MNDPEVLRSSMGASILASGAFASQNDPLYRRPDFARTEFATALLAEGRRYAFDVKSTPPKVYEDKHGPWLCVRTVRGQEAK